MNEHMSQSEVDKVFNDIFPKDINPEIVEETIGDIFLEDVDAEMRIERLFEGNEDGSTLDDVIETLNRHYARLKDQGYSDQEIQEIFDTYADRGRGDDEV